MKFLKRLKKTFLISSIVSFCLIWLWIFITWIMQGYCKGFLDPMYDEAITEKMLDKKRMWAELGETHIFLYITIGLIVCYLITLVVYAIIKRRKTNG